MADLVFKYGSMGSSKSAFALMLRVSYMESGKNVLLLKPSIDTRDGCDIIKSRVGIEARCKTFSKDERIITKFIDDLLVCDVIIVDEAQFATKSQIDELKAEGIGPGDQEYDMYLKKMGLGSSILKNRDSSKLSSNNAGNNEKLPNNANMLNNTIKPTPSKSVNVSVPKKTKLKRAIRAGLLNKGNKHLKKYKGKSNFQVASMLGKRAAGLGAKAALAYAGATAAGIASITGGDMEKGASNMIAAGVGGYALGKGISNKINSIDHKSDIDAMREAYYGDEYKAVQQKKAEEKFAKDEKNIKRIEQKLKVDREKAKEIAKEMATYTDKEGINDVDTTLAIYQMQQEGWDLEDARYAASYNNVAFDGKNTNYMKEKDREDYKNSFKSKLMSRDGVKENDANVKANNLFRAMDRFNELKS